MEKFVVIGTGFIGEYMGKGMRNAAGKSDLADIARGVKGSEKGVKERAEKLGYPVSVNDSRDALRQVMPSVIILSPPPEIAPDMVKNILAPHFENCRRRGAKTPDIYSFIPSPSADWICENLGGEANVVKILPNILDNVCGYDLSPIGINYISYGGHSWPEERKQLLFKFLSPYGYTAETDDVDSLVLLAGKITSHVCYEVSYTIARRCEKRGFETGVNRIGGAMRAAQYRIFPNLPAIAERSDEGVPRRLREFFPKFMKSWYDGLHRFTLENRHTVSRDSRQHIDMCSFALNVFPIRYSSRRQLEQDTKNAATKGGILERGIEVYLRQCEGALFEAVYAALKGDAPGEDFYKWAQAAAHHISSEAYKRSLDLSGKK